MEPLIVSLARKAFQAHIAAQLEIVGTPEVKPPQWDDIGEEHRAAWMATVAAIRPDVGTYADAVMSLAVGDPTEAVPDESVPRPTSPSAELGDSGARWGAEFIRVLPALPMINEEIMAGWFANAIEAGCDARIASGLYQVTRAPAPTSPPPDPHWGSTTAPRRMWACAVPGCPITFGPMTANEAPRTCPDHQPPADQRDDADPIPGPFRSIDERDGYWRGFDAGAVEAIANVAAVLGKHNPRDRVLEIAVGSGAVKVYQREIKRDPPLPQTQDEARRVLIALLADADPEDLTPGAQVEHAGDGHHATIVEVVTHSDNDPATHRLRGQALSVICACGGAWELNGQGAGRLNSGRHRQVLATLRLLGRQPENVAPVPG
jgi:hypothetical protein